jgi:hypothetical protein
MSDGRLAYRQRPGKPLSDDDLVDILRRPIVLNRLLSKSRCLRCDILLISIAAFRISTGNTLPNSR